MTILVTGGAGFIGSAVVRHCIAETDDTVINVDALTYAGNLESLGPARDHPRHVFEHVDITERTALDRVFREQRPDAVMHLAAESHVDRSIDGPAAFVETNITGTHNLLEATRAYWNELEGVDKQEFRFHHVSTDEVYGDLGPEDPAFTEDTPYAPSSPYAASKAASDHLVRAWHRTYGLPTLITNCSNNYGPYQFPEKMIPLMILNAIEGKPLPVYGKGQNVRDWLHVHDHARALTTIYREGRVGDTYNVGGGAERTNLEVVEALCASLDERHPRPDGRSYREQIEFVADRPGHDFRYAMDYSHLASELGWQPRHSFASGIDDTVSWYLQHTAWCDRVRHAAHERRGLASAPAGAST